MTNAPLCHPGPDRILLAGDWHGSTYRALEVIRYAGAHGIDTVLQLGDFGFWTPGPDTDHYLNAIEKACVVEHVTLLVVDGNHECFPALYKLPIDTDTGLRTIRPSIHHLPRGMRWRWHGTTWMALGGAHSVDRRDRTKDVSWWPEEHLSDEDLQRASTGPVDVIVAHDAPDGFRIPGLVPGAFPVTEIATSEWHRARVGAVVDRTSPAVLFHGHYHVKYSAERGTTKIFGLADDSGRLRNNIAVLEMANTDSFPESGRLLADRSDGFYLDPSTFE